MKKLDLFRLHPNLRMRLDDHDLGAFIAELLQSLHDLEEQVEHNRAQTIIDNEDLRTEREQLKLERRKLVEAKNALIEEKNRLIKFQSFIMKLASQIEESGHAIPAGDLPLPKRKTAS